MPNDQTLKFEEATLDQCVNEARENARAGDDWHNHVIKPTCVYNPAPGRYVLIIENNSTGKVLGHISDSSPVEAEKEIVRLRHGGDIIGGVETSMPTENEPEILLQIRMLARSNTDWHHHMMLPNCVLNPHPGKWTITLESAETEEIMEYVTDDEPRTVLSEIEALFFKQFG